MDGFTIAFAVGFGASEDGTGRGTPPADVTIAHLLLLWSDEAEFLRLANATRNRSDLWNGEYMRRMRNRRVVLTEVEEVA